MARIKVVTRVKPLTAAPVDQVIAWGSSPGWPAGTEVKAVLLFTDSCPTEGVFAHGTGTGIGFQGRAGMSTTSGIPTDRFAAWAGVMDGGQFGNTQAQTYTAYDVAIVTATMSYPTPTASSGGQILMGVDHFTIRWTSNHAGPRIVHAIAFGEIEDSYVTVFNLLPGPQTVTGLPWCPDLMMAISYVATGEPSGIDNAGALGLGLANHAGEQCVALTCHYQIGDWPTVFTNTGRQLLPGAFAGRLDYHADGTPLIQQATSTAFIPGGFTYTGIKTGLYTTRIAALCLKGIASQIGVTTKPTGSAPHPIALTEMTRAAGLLLTGVGAVSGGPYPHDRLGIGAWDGLSAAATTHTSQDHHRSTAAGEFGYHAIGNAHAIGRDSACYIRVNSDGIMEIGVDLPPAGEDAHAHGVSLTPSAVTLSWSPNDADAMALGYCVVGSGTHGVCEPVIETPLGPIAGCGATFGPELCAPTCPPDPPGLSPEAVEVRAAFRAALFLLGIGTAPLPGALAAITGCGATFANDPCGGLVRPEIPETCEAPLGAFELGASCLGEPPGSPVLIRSRSRRHAR